VPRTPGPAERPPRREHRRVALDLHFSAPAVAEGERFHRIESPKPLEVHGICWPFAEGEDVAVDLVVEELRAQVLIPEDALRKLEAERQERQGSRRQGGDSSQLKPERVQARRRREVVPVAGGGPRVRREER
jgi:hypothetical protein